MAIAFRGAGTLAGADGAFPNGGATISPPLPTGWQPGDIAITIVQVASATATGISTPTGWTVINTASLTGQKMALYWRRLQSGDTNPSFTMPISNSETMGGCIVAYSGCIATGTPFENYSISSGTAPQSGAVTIPSQAVTTDGADRMGLNIHNLGQNLASTPPTGWTERFDNGRANFSNYVRVAVIDQTIPSAGTVTPASRNLGLQSATPYFASGLALIPDTGGGTDPGTTKTKNYYTKSGGVWKAIDPLYVKSGGAWKEPTNYWVKDGGVWKKVYGT